MTTWGNNWLMCFFHTNVALIFLLHLKNIIIKSVVYQLTLIGIAYSHFRSLLRLKLFNGKVILYQYPIHSPDWKLFQKLEKEI